MPFLLNIQICCTSSLALHVPKALSVWACVGQGVRPAGGMFVETVAIIKVVMTMTSAVGQTFSHLPVSSLLVSPAIPMNVS